MTIIKKKCKLCTKTFKTPLKEHKRGNGLFCSLSCAAKYTNENRKKFKKQCVICSKNFISKCTTAKYCSHKCRTSIKKGISKSKNHLSRKILSLGIDINKCTSCGWNKTICDIHHIVPRSKNGSSDLNNLVILCPNCHRLIHKDILDISTILTISDQVRTISSSIKMESGALAGNPVVSAPALK